MKALKYMLHCVKKASIILLCLIILTYVSAFVTVFVNP